MSHAVEGDRGLGAGILACRTHSDNAPTDGRRESLDADDDREDDQDDRKGLVVVQELYGGGEFDADAALPSFVATTLFALEGATRSAVVLGLVGAGGIGIELSVSMQLLRYDEALTIIIVIFLVVVGVERISAAIRRRVI
jgi:ABC-type phosphate/phosphonate transport system permease subunit